MYTAMTLYIYIYPTERFCVSTNFFFLKALSCTVDVLTVICSSLYSFRYRDLDISLFMNQNFLCCHEVDTLHMELIITSSKIWK